MTTQRAPPLRRARSRPGGGDDAEYGCCCESCTNCHGLFLWLWGNREQPQSWFSRPVGHDARHSMEGTALNMTRRCTAHPVDYPKFWVGDLEPTIFTAGALHGGCHGALGGKASQSRTANSSSAACPRSTPMSRSTRRAGVPIHLGYYRARVRTILGWHRTSRAQPQERRRLVVQVPERLHDDGLGDAQWHHPNCPDGSDWEKAAVGDGAQRGEGAYGGTVGGWNRAGTAAAREPTALSKPCPLRETVPPRRSTRREHLQQRTRARSACGSWTQPLTITSFWSVP